MNELPKNVEEGMNVYDRNKEKIGTVETLRFGDEAAAHGQAPEGFRDHSLIGNLAEAIWPDDMPEGERAILLSEGYMILDADGLMARDRYIRPSQIAAVDSDGVHLAVRRQDLAKT